MNKKLLNKFNEGCKFLATVMIRLQKERTHYFEMGLKTFEKGDYEKATNNFDKYLSRIHNDNEVKWLFIISLFFSDYKIDMLKQLFIQFDDGDEIAILFVRKFKLEDFRVRIHSKLDDSKANKLLKEIFERVENTIEKEGFDFISDFKDI